MVNADFDGIQGAEYSELHGKQYGNKSTNGGINVNIHFEDERFENGVVNLLDSDVPNGAFFKGCTFRYGLSAEDALFRDDLNLDWALIDGYFNLRNAVVLGDLRLYETRIYPGLGSMPTDIEHRGGGTGYPLMFKCDGTNVEPNRKLRTTEQINLPHVIGHILYDDRTLVRSGPYQMGIDDWHLGAVVANAEGLRAAVLDNADPKAREILEERFKPKHYGKSEETTPVKIF